MKLNNRRKFSRFICSAGSHVGPREHRIGGKVHATSQAVLSCQTPKENSRKGCRLALLAKEKRTRILLFSNYCIITWRIKIIGKIQKNDLGIFPFCRTGLVPTGRQDFFRSASATTLRSTQRSRQLSMGGPDARIVPGGSTPGGSTPGGSIPGGSTVKSRGLSNQQNISLSSNNMSTHSNIYPPKKKIFLKDWQCPLPMTDRARGQKQARYVVEAATDLVKVDGYYLDHCKCIYFCN